MILGEFFEHLVVAAACLLFGCILIGIWILPTWVRARSVGVKLSMQQAFNFAIRKNNSIGFFTGLAEIRKWSPEITDEKIETHYMAGGDVLRLAQAIALMRKKNRVIDDQTFIYLTGLDLIGRDFESEIEKAEANNWNFVL